jgi:hypothetical protein
MKCELCNSEHPTVIVTVPMAGFRPEYPVCDGCLEDISVYVSEMKEIPEPVNA